VGVGEDAFHLRDDLRVGVGDVASLAEVFGQVEQLDGSGRFLVEPPLEGLPPALAGGSLAAYQVELPVEVRVLLLAAGPAEERRQEGEAVDAVRRGGAGEVTQRRQDVLEP